MDITCAKCGEPWDAYGVRHGDMEPSEAARFLRGEGCPGCRFGTACPLCSGSGRAESYHGSSCQTCHDRGYTVAWSLTSGEAAPYEIGEFYVGYSPNVRHVPAAEIAVRQLGVRRFPELIRYVRHRDGDVADHWLACPNGCADRTDFEPCTSCDGTGQLTVGQGTELEAARIESEAAASELEYSDEEPMGILIRRGLL